MIKWLKQIRKYFRQRKGQHIHSKVAKQIVNKNREDYIKTLKKYGYVDYTE